MIVADTDVLIDLLGGKKTAPAQRAQSEMERGNLATTVVTRFELLSGGEPGRQLERIEALLRGLVAFPLEARAADRAAEIRRRLEKRGLAIGMADTLIAGIVLDQEASLLTRNLRHFARVEELRLENSAG